MKERKDCPICEEEVSSDAAVKEFCALCGMAVPAGVGLEGIRGKETIRFCNLECLDKYVERDN
ncbi:hypothetical protein HY991_04675 [Candidatus Micrarchaeota archaeon]|nr:hypothetical protein [Candidatus Micrarchaeota archaeon]